MNEKHLEFLQNNITRMNQCSFQMKGWAITIVSAFIAAYVATITDTNPGNKLFIIVAIIPTIISKIKFQKGEWMMNVPFVTGDADMDAKFVKEATAAGFTNLKGHRSVGGMRASIYNAMPIEGVEALVTFMKKFEEENL